VKIRQRGLTHSGALIAVCAVLGLLLLVEISIDWTAFNKPADDEPPPPNTSTDLPEPLPAAEIDVEKFRVILDRPLFNATRRPPDGDATVVVNNEPIPTSKAAAGAVNLLGIVIIADNRRALMRFGPDNTRLVSKGENIDGWELKEIEESAVRIARSGREQRIELLRKGGPKRRTQKGSGARRPPQRPAAGQRAPTLTAPLDQDIEALEGGAIQPKIDENLLFDTQDTN
jgi:type II secretory pathway component PulC